MLLSCSYRDPVSERLRPSQAGAGQRSTAAAPCRRTDRSRSASRPTRASIAKENIAKPPTEDATEEADLAEPTLPADAKPLATETGLASWYGPPYHNRRGSNGEVYNMHAMTAAHRTYPLGSIVRVTNVKTGAHALVRITDRGPFIPGRVVDLSLAAARKLDVWKPGVAEVKVELMQSGRVCRSRRENGPCRLADSLTNPPPPNSPTTSSAAIAPPMFYASRALPETGGSVSACSTTITTAPRSSPPKPKLPKAQSSWFVSIKVHGARAPSPPGRPTSANSDGKLSYASSGA